MKNLLIGLAIVLIIGGAWWYFGQKNCQTMDKPMSMNCPMNTRENSKKEAMVTCPVMGTKMDKAKAYGKTEYKGKTYYFCCAGCPGEFKKNPEKYAK